MCITTKDGRWIATDYDAREFLELNGFDKWDIEEFSLMLRFGNVCEVESELEDLRDTVKQDERYQDALYGALVDILNFTDDMLRKARTKEARQLLQAVKDEITHSEVF